MRGLSVCLLGVLLLCLCARASSDSLGLIDGFLAAQMDYYTAAGPRVMATFSSTMPPSGALQCFDSATGMNYTSIYGYPLSEAADMYDNALAAMYFLERGSLSRAQAICDAFVLLERRGVPGVCPQGGCTVAAVMANDTAFTTAPGPQNAQVSVGNLMWQAMALQRCGAYVSSRKADYLASAEHIASWVIANRRSDTGGFVLNAGSGVASTEHNIDATALFRNLHASTGNATYLAAQQHAGQFVGRMWNNGFFVAGSLEDGSINTQLPVPLDAQAWTDLAAVNVPAQNVKQAIAWALTNMLVNTTNTCPGAESFFGSSFSQCSHSMKADGTCGVQNEETASLALALLLNADHAAEAEGDALLASLQAQQLSAPIGAACTRPPAKGPANGIVATPVPRGVNAGFYYCYPNAYHVASTAWTGLALLAKTGSKTANPFVSCE